MPGGPWATAAYVWAVGMAALVLGLVIGWRACLSWARAEWEDDEEPAPLVVSVLSLAAALPGPPPPGVRIPGWQESAIAEGLTLARAERHRQYHRLFTPELYEGNEEIANEIAERVARGH